MKGEERKRRRRSRRATEEEGVNTMRKAKKRQRIREKGRTERAKKISS